MTKAVEYKIVHGTQSEVEQAVNELSQDGWQLNGSVQVTHINGHIYFTQSLVKEAFIRGPWN